MMQMKRMFNKIEKKMSRLMGDFYCNEPFFRVDNISFERIEDDVFVNLKAQWGDKTEWSNFTFSVAPKYSKTINAICMYMYVIIDANETSNLNIEKFTK